VGQSPPYPWLSGGGQGIRVILGLLQGLLNTRDTGRRDTDSFRVVAKSAACFE